MAEQNIGGKVYGVNFDGLLVNFMCGWGLLNKCTCASTFDTTSLLLQECMDAHTRGWTGVQMRRRLWFW